MWASRNYLLNRLNEIPSFQQILNCLKVNNKKEVLHDFGRFFDREHFCSRSLNEVCCWDLLVRELFSKLI